MAVIRRIFSFLFVAILATGCGQVVKETLHVPPSSPTSVDCPKKIVVLPFADYFYADDMRAGLKRNSMVMEFMVDRLTEKGVQVPVQEDVLQYLVDNEIIELLPPDDQRGGRSNVQSIVDELSNEWSDTMKEMLKKYIASENSSSDKTAQVNEDFFEAPGIYALDKKNVREIGSRFQADYLVRGRIIEWSYYTKDRTKFSPFNSSQAVVQLRVWVQNTATGEVVWTNRSEVKVSPQYYSSEKESALFNMALSKAATSLINDFWSKANS